MIKTLLEEQRFTLAARKGGSMTKIYPILFLALVFETAAQPVVNISGTITDINGKTLSGASVKLLDLGLSTATDSVGHFLLSLIDVNAAKRKAHYYQPYISGDFLNFTVPNGNSRVKIDAFDCKGRLVFSVLDKEMPDGAYRIAPCSPTFPKQLYLLRLTIGTVCTFFKMPYVHDSMRKAAPSAGARADFSNLSLAKKTAVIDTLEVALSGYITEKKPLDSYFGNYYIVLSKNSDAQIYFDKLDYLSAAKATITVTDTDLDANVPYLQIAVSSTSEPNGILFLLSPVSGNPGTFSGVMNFSTKTPAQNTILVYDGDTIIAVYSDANPPSYIKTTAVWHGMVGKVSVDSASYKGQSKMTITVKIRMSWTVHLR